MNAVPLPFNDLVGLLSGCLDEARRKHPVWPEDVVHQAAIVAEEAGELVKAALQVRYEGGSWPAARLEALHVLVTASRFLMDSGARADASECPPEDVIGVKAEQAVRDVLAATFFSPGVFNQAPAPGTPGGVKVLAAKIVAQLRKEGLLR